MGGNPINLSDITDFNTMISQTELIDGGFNESKFTWSNNRLGRVRIMERLDRVLYNSAWLNLCNIVVMHLNRSCLDHVSLLISWY